MGKDELVEMINSTINTNGSGAITGEALNLALQAIVETMGTGSGSGAEKLQGYFDGSAWQQTDDEKALNAQLYAKIVSAIEKMKRKGKQCYMQKCVQRATEEFNFETQIQKYLNLFKEMISWKK